MGSKLKFQSPLTNIISEAIEEDEDERFLATSALIDELNNFFLEKAFELGKLSPDLGNDEAQWALEKLADEDLGRWPYPQELPEEWQDAKNLANLETLVAFSKLINRLAKTEDNEAVDMALMDLSVYFEKNLETSPTELYEKISEPLREALLLEKNKSESDLGRNPKTRL